MFGEAPGANIPRPAKTILVNPPAISEHFPIGEQLHYTFYWFGIPVIRGEMHVQDDTVLVNGRPHVTVAAGAQSTGLVRRLFAVDDETATLMDVETLFPSQHQTIFHHRASLMTEQLVFHRDRGIASSTTGKPLDIPIDPASARGPIGACYYLRTLDLHEDRPIQTEVVANGKSWEVKARVVRRGDLTIAQGTFRVLEIEVDARWLRRYLRHSAAMRVWVSDDPFHVPLMAKVKLPFIGSLTAVLTDCSPRWPATVALPADPPTPPS